MDYGFAEEIAPEQPSLEQLVLPSPVPDGPPLLLGSDADDGVTLATLWPTTTGTGTAAPAVTAATGAGVIEPSVKHLWLRVAAPWSRCRRARKRIERLHRLHPTLWIAGGGEALSTFVWAKSDT